jgi:hypothetical protein
MMQAGRFCSPVLPRLDQLDDMGGGWLGDDFRASGRHQTQCVDGAVNQQSRIIDHALVSGYSFF